MLQNTTLDNRGFNNISKTKDAIGKSFNSIVKVTDAIGKSYNSIVKVTDAIGRSYNSTPTSYRCHWKKFQEHL